MGFRSVSAIVAATLIALMLVNNISRVSSQFGLYDDFSMESLQYRVLMGNAVVSNGTLIFNSSLGSWGELIYTLYNCYNENRYIDLTLITYRTKIVSFTVVRAYDPWNTSFVLSLIETDQDGDVVQLVSIPFSGICAFGEGCFSNAVVELYAYHSYDPQSGLHVYSFEVWIVVWRGPYLAASYSGYTTAREFRPNVVKLRVDSRADVVIDDFFILCAPSIGGTSPILTVTQTVTSTVTVLQPTTVTVAAPATITYTKAVTEAPPQIQLPQLDWGSLIPISLSVVAVIIAVVALARTRGTRSITPGAGSQVQPG